MILDDVLVAIKHFEGQQRRYMKEHDGRACVHLGAALVALKDKALALTVAAEPVRHAQWEYCEESDSDKCTNCGFVVSRGYGYNKPGWKHCPNCTARVDLDHLGDTAAMVEKEDSNG